jgi:alpha-tubulin suppressor-like RCC1 family protein
MKIGIFILAMASCLNLARAGGINWPANQLLPTFPAPAPVLDCIDVSSASSAELDLFASLEGIVNRTQPQIACASSVNGEGEFTWINLHNLPYTLTSGYSAILQYRTNLTGLVVTDPNQPDTLNLATTMAGVNNELICNPCLLPTLTNAPYNLPIVDDLRGRFANKYAVYGYLYTNYWPLCTHRIIAGMETNLDGNLRDYLVALKSATVWLDPGNSQDAAMLALFLSGTTPVNCVYMGWWPNEGNGLSWIGNYGIPVVASDYFCNGSLFSGVTCPINVPGIPPPPPLANKVYVALILSDGDNAQYMQHAMKINWENGDRGKIPIGWTVDPLTANFDPAMLDYYWSTATANDCLISGPSGAGYARVEYWNTANLTALASASDAYLQRSGLRVITVWDEVNSAIAQTYALNCPTLLGLTDQNGTYSAVNLGLRTIAETPTYASTTNQMISAITSAAAGWNGTAPVFIVAQASAWSLVPSDLVNIANTFNTNEFQFVRPDHLFMLNNQVFGPPLAVTQPAIGIAAGSAALKGIVSANATNTTAWLEWGTNNNYGSQSAATNLGNSGNSFVGVSTVVTGLKAWQTYHYQVVASNILGKSRGGDKVFTTGGRLEVWGSGALGETNVPPGLTNVIGISCGAYHGLALKNDGTVAAWGYNSYGQTNVPAGLSNVVAVAGGIRHSLALMANGTVAAWGDNTYGQTNVPAGLTNVVAIAAGGYHNLALLANQTVTAWGYNAYGQTNVPAGLTNVVGMAAGYGHNLALLANGTVVAWGYNVFNQTNVPTGLSNVVSVAAGEYHSMALKANNGSSAGLGPVGRWVADSLSGSNGSPVSNWVDSVAGISASQPAAGSQPGLYANVLNGHNTVRFSSAGKQYLTVMATNSPISGAGDFTMVVVFRTSTLGNASSSFYLNTGLLGADQPGATNDWSFVINGTELGAGLGAAGGGCSADASLYGGNVTDGNPHIGAYVRSGGTIRLYVDGVIVAEQTSLCTAARGSDPFEIGAMTTAPYFFNGDIAEIQLYNRALNSWEMANLNGVLAGTYGMSGIAGAPVCQWVADYLAGSNGSSVSNWTDSLGGRSATQGSAGNQPQLYSNVLNGHSTVRFSSASSQFLTVTAAESPISGAGSFTMVVVFRTSTPGNASSSFYLNTGLLGADVPGAVDDWSFVINGSQLGAGLGAGANGCSADFSLYGGDVTDGNPHIGMYVRAGATISLYVDGALVASQNALCPDARIDCLFDIGAMTTAPYYFNGDIAEIQLYNRALSSWEIMSANEILAGTYGVGSAGGLVGTVVAWGDNASDQASVPANLANVSAVASGNDSSFNLALEANGSTIGWGNNNQGQTSVPAGLTNVSAIAAGSVFGLAIGNQPPQAGNVTVSGYVNHDLSFALPAVSPDGNQLNFLILSLPAAGALYQYSGGTPGLPIITPNTSVSDPAGRVIFAPAAGAEGNPYAAFNFMVNDGFYSSGSAQVSVNIGLPETPQLTGVSWNPGTLETEGVNLNFSGAPNATYSIWATTNLVNWLDIGTATEAQPGLYEFTDATVTNWPERFYRISAP